MGKNTPEERETGSKTMEVINMPSEVATKMLEARLHRVSYVAPDVPAHALVQPVRRRRRSQYSQPILDTNLYVSTYDEVPCPPSSVQMTQMIVVSNRLPFVLKRDDETGKLVRNVSAGGLVTAMAPVVVQTKGFWIGWPGLTMTESDEIPDGVPDAKNPCDQICSSQIGAVNIDPGVLDDYYSGCCNATFWPLLHSMPDRAVFQKNYWTAYEVVNQQFAEQTFQTLKNQLKGSMDCRPPLVWIHDYQLMLVPNLCRQRLDEYGFVNCRISFFLHIPFPAWDIFRLLPWSDEIIVGLLGCDLIGFHIEGYVDNFLDCCSRGLGCRVDRERRLILHDGRTIRVQPFPIGIPFNRFDQMSRESTATKPDDECKLVLGVDRLDYTKGIILRVKAFEKLLDDHPQHKEKVVLLQVAVPSRTDVLEYQELKDELDREIGRINGRLSTSSWSPIRYIYRFMDQEELCGYYRDAFVGLVTPIRDGMNLVAKEFVACQTKTPGVLILSPFTGAGETMHEALIVNPLEINMLADTINRALTMPLDERELRMSALRSREKKFDVHNWVKTFLSATGVFNGDGTETQFEPLTIHHFQKWLAHYVEGSMKLVLLLDYDGTLAPLASHPDSAVLPEQTRHLLEVLVKMTDVYVAVISGRSIKNVKAMVNIEDITYAGNHGLDIEHPDGTKFIHPDQARYATLLADLHDDLQAICCEGAWVEMKGFAMTVHYRNVVIDRRPPIMEQATAVILKHGFRPMKAHCALEARPPIEWDKGRASIHLLRTTFGIDWSERVRIIYCGDDTTDEEAMAALKGMAVTFRVANSRTVRTNATHRLPDTKSVQTLLEWVVQHMSKRQKKLQEEQESCLPVP